jgi:hypothetical protein
MKKIIQICLSLLLLSSLSCSKDEGKTVQNVVVTSQPIKITSFNKDNLKEGEELVITGTNFLSQNYPTKLIFKNSITNLIVEKTIVPISDTEIRIILTSDICSGQNFLTIKINQSESNSKILFLLPKNWFKINNYQENIFKSQVFDNSDVIFSGIDTANYYLLKKLNLNDNNGFLSIPVSSNLCIDFEMRNLNEGVNIGSSSLQTSNNSFSSVLNNFIYPNNVYCIYHDGANVFYLNDNTFIYLNVFGAMFITNNNGQDFSQVNLPIVYNTNCIGGSGTTCYRANVNLNKSLSDNKFYILGYTINNVNGTDVLKTNILQSADCLSWVSIGNNNVFSDLNRILNIRFLDINKLYSISSNNILQLSTDRGATWKDIKNNVKKFSIRNENTWYIHSSDKILVTNNAGFTWQEELQLPANAVLNDISFSNNKIIVSGNNGLLYLKNE